MYCILGFDCWQRSSPLPSGVVQVRTYIKHRIQCCYSNTYTTSTRHAMKSAYPPTIPCDIPHTTRSPPRHSSPAYKYYCTFPSPLAKQVSHSPSSTKRPSSVTVTYLEPQHLSKRLATCCKVRTPQVRHFQFQPQPPGRGLGCQWVDGSMGQRTEEQHDQVTCQ